MRDYFIVGHILRAGMPPTDRTFDNDVIMTQFFLLFSLLAVSAIVLTVARCFGCISARECDDCAESCFSSACNSLPFLCM